MSISITTLLPEHEQWIAQVAAIMVEAFREFAPTAWPGLEDGLEEVKDSFQEGRISRVAINAQGEAIGWIGGIEQYDGNVWELHPLAVHPAWQDKGVGRALVADLEEQVRERGGITIMLGTDDETGNTSLSGKDLYPDVWQHVREIRNPGRHPYAFYQKQGFVIVGIIPDANGFGKPDILMAKRVSQQG